jgi:hypothetical protein
MSGTSPGLQNTLEQAKQTRLNAKKSFPHGLGQLRTLASNPDIEDHPSYNWFNLTKH